MKKVLLIAVLVFQTMGCSASEGARTLEKDWIEHCAEWCCESEESECNCPKNCCALSAAAIFWGLMINSAKNYIACLNTAGNYLTCINNGPIDLRCPLMCVCGVVGCVGFASCYAKWQKSKRERLMHRE